MDKPKAKSSAIDKQSEVKQVQDDQSALRIFNFSYIYLIFYHAFCDFN